MTWLDRITLFTPLDFAAVGLLLLGWLVIGWRIEHPAAKHPSTSQIMAGFRREWMQQMITRQPRIFDAQIVASLRQGTAFFASTSMIAIGGTLALIGNAERLTGIANDLILTETPAFVWEIKMLMVVLFLTNAFLKFVWANRLFGYAAVVMAAVPNDTDDPVCTPRAAQAAEINITAARSFNRGLRSVYFALACIAWLAGPLTLIAATLFTLAVIWRREFASNSRTILLGTDT
ncbi:DUF599 domain-containing protein [Tateyamaria omphalii]|uniref:DUF599 domain-containing protein n=1 Tax=Tateyamaria omphalii TaxID=299262 RepID=A0A1P8N0S4_9RHOB|nr:DUF599 domain-containing protein [Tateyamaria omphalii]APX13921.1 hypothetical protein BWR18_15190 [Tateyamaria omphalii]